MIITEPTTMLTDYAIVIESFWFAGLLLHYSVHVQQRSVRLWAIAFGFVAVAAFLGGTCHGFTLYLSRSLLKGLWQTMIYALSLASFFMLAATIISTLPYRMHRWVLFGVGLKSILYLLWASQANHFSYAIADYASAMVLVLLLEIRMLYREQKSASTRWIIAGILVSGVAVGIEATQVTIAEAFNHNDLYHLVQMIALYLFYRGARLLQDQTNARMPSP